MLFDTKEDLQMTLRKYCVAQHYQIVMVESNQDTLQEILVFIAF